MGTGWLDVKRGWWDLGDGGRVGGRTEDGKAVDVDVARMLDEDEDEDVGCGRARTAGQRL